MPSPEAAASSKKEQDPNSTAEDAQSLDPTAAAWQTTKDIEFAGDHEKPVPEKLYRGLTIQADEVPGYTLEGQDILPGTPAYTDEQGRKTVRDGNEYGIYMSDNQSVAAEAYALLGAFDGKIIDQNIKLGASQLIPAVPPVGILYEINTEGMEVRQPWISDTLSSVYNNGFAGDEWIADRIPAENYQLARLQIGPDFLHDKETLDLQDRAHLKDTLEKRLADRTKRLERCLDLIRTNFPTAQKRSNMSETTIQIFRDLLGDNGAAYEDPATMTASTAGDLARYLLAWTYQSSPEQLELTKLKQIEEAKQRVPAESEPDSLITALRRQLAEIEARRQKQLERSAREHTEPKMQSHDKQIADISQLIAAAEQKLHPESNSLTESGQLPPSPEVSSPGYYTVPETAKLPRSDAESIPNDVPRSTLATESLSTIPAPEAAQTTEQEPSTTELMQEYLALLHELSAGFTSKEAVASAVVSEDGMVRDRRGYSGDQKFIRRLYQIGKMPLDESSNYDEWHASGQVDQSDLHYTNPDLDRAHTLRMVDDLLKSEASWREAGQDFATAQTEVARAETELEKATAAAKAMPFPERALTFFSRRKQRKVLQQNLQQAQERRSRAELTTQRSNQSITNTLNAAYSPDYHYGHHSLDYQHAQSEEYKASTNTDYNERFFSAENQAKINRAIELRKLLGI